MSRISNSHKILLEKHQYEFAGDHTAIKVCSWAKSSIRDEGFCYKQKFYGISSHQCCQMSPSIGYCQNRCIFCWRPIEYTEGKEMKGKVDDPKKLVDSCILAHRKQLIGFKGSSTANKKKLGEAMDPKHLAISLAGEPLIYPKINQLIREAHKRGMTTFLVTNGLLPAKLARIEPPTQLYLSLDAPDELLFRKVDQSTLKDGWIRLDKSLRTLKKLKAKTRTAIRVTLIKDVNMVNPEGYAALISKADPDFLEIKAYMHVGFSQLRLKKEHMPTHEEVVSFAGQIGKRCGYRIVDEKTESRVALLMKDGCKKDKLLF